MSRPEGVSDEVWEKILEERADEKRREMLYGRIMREGYEADGEDPNPEQTCVSRAQRKRRNRWVVEPCGARAVVVLTMRSPDNPEGLRVPLCRACLATHVRKLITLLEFFA
jgi:hypothetical protein